MDLLLGNYLVTPGLGITALSPFAANSRRRVLLVRPSFVLMMQTVLDSLPVCFLLSLFALALLLSPLSFVPL